MRAPLLPLLPLLLAGCAHEPVPDAQAPVVLHDAVRAAVAVAVPRDPPPAELLAPMRLDVPDVLPPGQGDYCLSRAGLESLVTAYRAAGERLARWKAWADTEPIK